MAATTAQHRAKGHRATEPTNAIRPVPTDVGDRRGETRT